MIEGEGVDETSGPKDDQEFENSIVDWINGTFRDLQDLKIEREAEILGLSGNKGLVDLAIFRGETLKAILEIKFIDFEKDSNYIKAQVKLSYAQLGDFQKDKYLKLVVLSQAPPSDFGYVRLYETIGADLIVWPQEEQKIEEMLRKALDSP